MKRIILWVIIGFLAVFLIIQFVPYGHNHKNPDIVNEPNWNSSQTRALAKRACFDCHSNETVWPWYSKIAPISWLIASDVSRGRERFNFSDWQGQSPGEISEVIQEGEMPPFYYSMMHSQARLSADEKNSLIEGISASLK